MVQKMSRRILRVTLTKQWFDLILLGKKKNEYRQYKKHWISRLIGKDDKLKSFDEVHFTNGYGADKPFVSAQCLGISIVSGMHHKPQNDEPLNELSNYFNIELGDVLEVRNINRL